MKLIGLLLTVVFVAGLVWMLVPSKPKDTTGAGTSGAAPATGATLGAPAPTDVGSNAQAAAQHTKRQVCLAECASEFRTCTTLAADPSGGDACAVKKAACDGACP